MTDDGPRRPARASAAARAAYGTVLLVGPGLLLTAVGERPDQTGLRRLTRVLGARHLVQAVAARSGALPPALGVVVDAVHAGTALSWAALSRCHRRVALVDAGLAAGWAAEGTLVAGAR